MNSVNESRPPVPPLTHETAARQIRTVEDG